MKNIEKFDERTGIVKIDHEGEKWFVVYSYLFDLPPYNHELGKAIAKGKTPHEAMLKAIIKLTKHVVDLQNSFESMQEKIEEVSRQFPCNKDEDIVIGLKEWHTRWNSEKENNEIYETEEISNADIGIDEEGKPFAFIA